MKVVEHLQAPGKPHFSFEIIPPQRGKSAKEILDIVEQLKPYEPKFIDVTSHSSEVKYEETKNGIIMRRIRKKRPGTISICGIIQNRFNIDTVAHLLCRGFTREETEDALIELNYLGIQNVLAIQGDEPNYKKPIEKHRSVNTYASELVTQIKGLRDGAYIEELVNADPIEMCIGVAGYPEKHFEAPNLKHDIQNLKRKVDNGADYIVTQMFFDNTHFFDFKRKCSEAQINVPIVPGLKIMDRSNHMKSLPRNFHIDFPEDLVEEVLENPKHVKEIGTNWCFKQCEELLNSGENHLHFYIMNDATQVLNVLNRLI